MATNSDPVTPADPGAIPTMTGPSHKIPNPFAQYKPVTRSIEEWPRQQPSQPSTSILSSAMEEDFGADAAGKSDCGKKRKSMLLQDDEEEVVEPKRKRAKANAVKVKKEEVDDGISGDFEEKPAPRKRAKKAAGSKGKKGKAAVSQDDEPQATLVLMPRQLYENFKKSMTSDVPFSKMSVVELDLVYKQWKSTMSKPESGFIDAILLDRLRGKWPQNDPAKRFKSLMEASKEDKVKFKVDMFTSDDPAKIRGATMRKAGRIITGLKAQPLVFKLNQDEKANKELLELVKQDVIAEMNEEYHQSLLAKVVDYRLDFEDTNEKKKILEDGSIVSLAPNVEKKPPKTSGNREDQAINSTLKAAKHLLTRLKNHQREAKSIPQDASSASVRRLSYIVNHPVMSAKDAHLVEQLEMMTREFALRFESSKEEAVKKSDVILYHEDDLKEAKDLNIMDIYQKYLDFQVEDDKDFRKLEVTGVEEEDGLLPISQDDEQSVKQESEPEDDELC